MVDAGKRHRRDDDDYERRNQKSRSGAMESSEDVELVVYRILCPDSVIGSVIGKNGKVINSLRQETHARIKVVDPFPGANKRIINIYCHVKYRETIDIDRDVDDREPLCPAQDALLKVHETIVNALANTEDSDRDEEAEILVPSSQASTIIGKSGVIIKRLRANSRANIKVTQKDPNKASHSCAMSFDNFVQITGDATSVRRALFQISAIMYSYPPKEEISLDTTVSELPPTIIIPADAPIYSAGSFYPSTDTIIGPHGSIPSIIGSTAHQPEVGAWPMFPSALPVVSGYGTPEHSEELIVRVLCPSDKIGRVIGKGGSTIKNIRQTSGARVDVDDTKKKSEECLMTVTSIESTNDEKSAAVEALLLLQEKIDDEDDEVVSIRLLVPSRVIGCLIGRSGSIINDIRKRTKTQIRISKGEKPKCAPPNDELVEVSGEVGNVRDALVQITLRLREDVLKDRDGTGKSNAPRSDNVCSGPPVLPRISPSAPLGYESYGHRAETGSGLGLVSGGSHYGYGALQAEDDGYRSLSSYSSKAYGGRVPSYTEMVIPSHALSKVIGRGGGNLANIRNLSGADIEIIDSKSSRYESIAQISGTSEQKRAAENMIKAFILST